MEGRLAEHRLDLDRTNLQLHAWFQVPTLLAQQLARFQSATNPKAAILA